MPITLDPVKFILGAIQTTYDGVVAPSGGDFSTIQDADDSLDAGNFTLLVKTGTYAGWTTSTDKAEITLAPGTVITSAVVLSGDDITLTLMPGCDIQGLLTMSGANVHVVAMNACDLDGVLMSGNFGYFNGGGWDTLVDGGAAVDGFQITGADCVIENTACQTTAGGGNALDGISVEDTRAIIRKVKIADSDNFALTNSSSGSDMLVEGCVILGADGQGFVIGGPRARIIGNWMTGVGADSIVGDSNSDNSVYIGNVIQDVVAAQPIQLNAGADNCVVAGNRTDGAVLDNSTGSTVAHNDETAF